MRPGNGSFTDFLTVAEPHLLPGSRQSAGVAVEMVRLFRLELEHYEKIEGVRLSLDGKANRLATMIRGNLGMAMQGLAVVPLFAGLEDSTAFGADPESTPGPGPGRIFSYDIAGGRYEEHDYYAVGSGSMFARSALKKRYEPGADLPTAVRAAVEALYDAADDDSATGGPDLTRRIFPVVVSVTAEGAVRWSDEEVGAVSEAVVAGRLLKPGG
jgi:proteasome beta subunit